MSNWGEHGTVTAHRRRQAGLAALTTIVVAAGVLGIVVGAQAIPLSGIWHALVSPTGLPTDQIVTSLRLPRTVLCLAVGIALGTAGALIQGHTRNPLADPGLLGLTAGAALLVVISMYAFGLRNPDQYVWFALAGSLVAGIVVFGVASVGGGNASPLNLALAGAAITFGLQALTNALVLQDTFSLDGYRLWVVGSAAGRDISVFWQVLPFLAVGLVLAVINIPALNGLNLGDDVARSLGINVAGARVIGLLSITLLAGAATAACGPIAFIGLIVPHLARGWVGPDYRWLVPYSALLGGLTLLVADIVGRIVVAPAELHVGIVTALIGAPVFIALVRRKVPVAP
ncbi:iron ABC transporter permease [Skermania sp. ID1734]|nr:iron ABC transporter permease [Skermania sp. ID1734]